MRFDNVCDMGNDCIVDLINSHLSRDVSRFEDLYNLYKGKHIILEKEEEENKPNNRLIGDYYGKLIDTEIGYFLGHPIVFNSEQEKAFEEFERILVENEFDDMIMEIGKEMGIKGKSYVMIYQDEESNTRLCRLSPENVVTVEAVRGRGDIGVAFRFYEDVVKNGENEDVVLYVEGYDSNYIYYYKLIDGVLSVNLDRGVNGKEPHIFGQVPIIVVKNNEEEMGSFEKVITLVDAYDKLLSDTSNEHEAYRNAYLVLKNITIDKDGEARLKSNGILEVFDDGEAYFLQKPILDSAINSHLDRLSKDIHKFSDIPDMSDENFAGNLSGVAIRFKLLGLENKAIIKERKMSKSIRKLVRCLNKVLLVSVGEEFIINKLDIKFTRNIPNNLVEIVDTVVKLDGIVDKETLLSLLPFVDNPRDIIDKLGEEAEVYKNSLDVNGDFIVEEENKGFDEIDE